MKSGFTPKQGAYDTAIGWLRLAYNEKTADVREYCDTPKEIRDYRRQVAKLHNRLLKQSGLDGLELEENVEE